MNDRLQNYSRVQIIPGKTYLCGCSYSGPYTVLYPQPGIVDKKECPTHGQPVAGCACDGGAHVCPEAACASRLPR